MEMVYGLFDILVVLLLFLTVHPGINGLWLLLISSNVPHMLYTSSRRSDETDVTLTILPQVLEWFWTIVASFTEEQMARLLQFTTGCSQLPAGGFGELNPNIQLSSSPTYNTLPTAHTWWVPPLLSVEVINYLLHMFLCVTIHIVIPVQIPSSLVIITD